MKTLFYLFLTLISFPIINKGKESQNKLSYLYYTRNLIMSFEGYSPSSYNDNGESAVGFGFRFIDGYKINPNTKLSIEESIDILDRKIIQINDKIIYLNLTDNQRIALISLIYNIGITSFNRSKLKKNIIDGDTSGIKKEWLSFRCSQGKVLRGLEKRRKKELQIFNL